MICYFWVDGGSICVDWTIIIFVKVLTYVQKTLGKISELCDCLSLFMMYFIMWNLFLSRSECSLCWCPCWPIAKSCMIPFFVNLSGLILVLCLRLRFLSFWVGVLILRLGTSEFSSICFYDWSSIDLFSYYLLESLIVIIALPETLCVSLEICYLSSVWNNAYEWLFYKQLYCF